MISLYILLSIMLIAAICLAAFARFSIVIILTMTIFSLGLYYLTANTTGINEWLLHGKKHYQLQVQLNKLGGIDGIIQRVKAKLEKDPNDAQGWLVLGKMYLINGNQHGARLAFDKARELAVSQGLPS